MKVIVASFPKCGTKTLKKCLTLLGYNVYDFAENFWYFESEWLDIWKNGATVEAFKKMYENIDAVTDIPGCSHWKMIHDAFPDSKIILTIRKSEEEWLASWDAQLEAIKRNVGFQLRSHLTPTGRRYLAFQRLNGHDVIDCPPQGFTEMMNQPDPEIKKRKYREHNQSVLQRAPKDKLLFFDFKDGWRPLCDFLGKEIPDVPFPHVNKRSVSMDERDVGTYSLRRRMNNELRFIGVTFLTLLAIILRLFY